MAKMSRSTRATVISVALSLGLLAIAGVFILLLPEPGPADLDEAKGQVLTGFDHIEASIPHDAVVASEDTTSTRACRAGGDEQEAQMKRVVTIDAEMDAVAWGNALSDAFPADESWLVELEDRVDQGQMRARVIGADLVVIRVSSSNDGEEARISMNAVSACAPAG